MTTEVGCGAGEGVVADAGDGVADDDRGQLRAEKAELPMLVTELGMTTEVGCVR